ncbi:hypothetical protein [Nocardioides sp. NPDC006273]|uniref:hypothetical protein n=1 Tax=Nocardioides sp. NPDC006273 TaxID=3155598 RepID=UPI0033A0E744
MISNPPSTIQMVPGKNGGPSQRRIARLLPAGSPQWTLLKVMREVRTPSWTPQSSAVRLANQVGDGRALREARVRLRLATIERATITELRALATLNLAINHFETTNAAGQVGA